MQSETINGQAVEVCIIAENGTELAESLTPAERGLLERMDAALKADAEFQMAHSDAMLVRIESNRGMADVDEGRFYLRYRHKGGMAEFWGNVGSEAGVDFEKGMVWVNG